MSLRPIRATSLLCLLGVAVALCMRPPRACAAEGNKMEITSSAFTPGGQIPPRYTCVGQDISPPLAWSGVPPGTKSLVLIMDDPDAPDPAHPKRTWVHWVLYNIPASTAALAEGAGSSEPAPPAKGGINDWTRPTYGGPCPPVGRHRYFFKLYALDTEFPAVETPTKAAVETAMQGHSLAQAELVGTFQK